MNANDPTGPAEKPLERASQPPAPLDAEVVLPEPLEAVLKQVPGPQRERIRESFLALLQVQGQMVNPLVGKLTPSHLDKLIEGAAEDNKLGYVDKREKRSHMRFVTIVITIAFLLLSALLLWKNQPALLRDIIQVALAFGGGVGAGGFLLPRKNGSS